MFSPPLVKRALLLGLVYSANIIGTDTDILSPKCIIYQTSLHVYTVNTTPLLSPSPQSLSDSLIHHKNKCIDSSNILACFIANLSCTQDMIDTTSGRS